MNRFILLAMCIPVIWCFRLNAQDLSAYTKEEFVQDSGVLPYRLLLPKDFDPTRRYPLILVLHGSGERGNDNEKQLTHGAALFLQETVRENYPAIVVFPQCSENSTWARIEVEGDFGNREFIFFEDASPTPEMALLEGLIAQLKEEYRIRNNGMYVGGLSMGGFGTFELVRRNPGMFAAAFPICGGANPKIARKLKRTAWWVFHGGADEVVPPKYSTQMVEALQQKRAKVKYSLYLAVKHNSWENAFAEPELLPWLFSKRK
ncbi:MAG: alpha/beta hydrolase-fold protein [Bacteroidota bacterium]